MIGTRVILENSIRRCYNVREMMERGEIVETLAFIFSTLGTICICIPPLVKGKNMKIILPVVFLSNALVAISYLLTGGFNGAVSCGIGAAQSIINCFYERKNKNIPPWLVAIYLASFAVVNLLVLTQVTDLIALVACFTCVAGICQKNGKKFRLWMLLNTTLWAIYDIITLSFGPLSTHAIQLVMILLGMVMHDRKKKT